MASFPQFTSPSMPPEIRDLIWTYAISLVPPRLVELHRGTPDTISTPEGEVIAVIYDLNSPAPIPEILHACSRSRELAQRRWTLTFASPFYYLGGHRRVLERPAISRTWFDFEGDTLLFLGGISLLDYPADHSNVIAEIDLPTRARVRNIAISVNDIISSHTGEDDSSSDDSSNEDDECFEHRVVAAIVEGFPGLRNFSLVLRDIAWGTWDQAYDLEMGFKPIVERSPIQYAAVERVRQLFEELNGVGEVEVDLVDLFIDGLARYRDRIPGCLQDLATDD